MELNKRTNKKLTTVEPDMKIIGIYRWFPHEIYQLIDLVKENQAIYNPIDKNYFCRRFIENTWRDIDIKLKKNPGSSLAKWTNLRICFRREYSSFLVDAVKPLWAYFDKMFFLHPYLRKKRPNSEHLESRIQEALEQINSSMTRARHNIRNCVKNIEYHEPEHDPESSYDERESYMNGGGARNSDNGGDGNNGDIMKRRHYNDDDTNRNNSIIEYVAESDDGDDQIGGDNVGNDDDKDDDDNLSIKNELIDAENNNDNTKKSDIESLSSASDTCHDSENNSNSNNLPSSINQINQNKSQAIKQQSSSSSSSSVLAVASRNYKRGHLKRKYESIASDCGTSSLSSITRNNVIANSSSGGSNRSKLIRQNSICKSFVAKVKEIYKKSKMKGNNNNPEQEQENIIANDLNNHSLEQHQNDDNCSKLSDSVGGDGGGVDVPDSEFFINKSQKQLKISKNDCTSDDTRTKTINNNSSIENLTASITNNTTTTAISTTNELCNCKLDPDAMFLMSLLPDVKCLSRKDKGKFKIEIQNLIQNYLYPESN